MTWPAPIPLSEDMWTHHPVSDHSWLQISPRHGLPRQCYPRDAYLPA